MNNERLQHLTLLSTVSEAMRDIAFEWIIRNFSEKEARWLVIAWNSSYKIELE